MTLGMRFKLARIANNLSQVDVAKRCDVSPNYLSLVENDHRAPSLKLLNKLAQIYRRDLVIDLAERKGA